MTNRYPRLVRTIALGSAALIAAGGLAGCSSSSGGSGSGGSGGSGDVGVSLIVKTTTNPVKTMTMSASPQSCGARSRARTRATTIRETCRKIWEPAFQARPLRMRAPIPSEVVGAVMNTTYPRVPRAATTGMPESVYPFG